MNERSAILFAIKNSIQAITPDAGVYLFGSRANGTASEESDWDILVLVDEPVTLLLKKEIHNRLFPLSVQAGAFFNTLVIQVSDWQTNPAYYSLHQTIDGRLITA
jgi:predicted nucleotidyltransferase